MTAPLTWQTDGIKYNDEQIFAADRDYDAGFWRLKQRQTVSFSGRFPIRRPAAENDVF